MPDIFGIDSYSPDQIAERVEAVGVKKAHLPFLSLVALGILAGGFIGLGACYYTVVTADPNLTFALSRVIGGLAFSLGLILVVIAGAELFTGNNLMVMAWVHRKITTRHLLRNLIIVFFANFIGAVGLAAIVALSGHATMNNFGVGDHAVAIANAKVALSFGDAFFRAILCNILVCLAVWLAMGARTVTGKILAIIFPISAFVACGFEHCIANMYLISLGIFLDGGATESLNWIGLAKNLVPVTLGNLVGGAGMVGLVYYVIYCLPPKKDIPPS
jgi:formate transporter